MEMGEMCDLNSDPMDQNMAYTFSRIAYINFPIE